MPCARAEGRLREDLALLALCPRRNLTSAHLNVVCLDVFLSRSREELAVRRPDYGVAVDLEIQG